MQRLAGCLVQQRKIPEALIVMKDATNADSDGVQRGIQRGTLVPEAIMAQLCEQANDRQDAKRFWVAALKAKPQDIKTRLAAARWAFETEQLDTALQQVNEALKLDERSIDARLYRGLIAAFQKDYATAEAYFEQIRLQAPDDFRATNNLALALVEQKDDSKKQRALKMAETNLKRYSKSADALSTYGWVLYKMGKPDADQYLREAFRLSGGAPDTAYYLAQIFRDHNQLPQAKELLEAALKAPGPFAMRQQAQALLEQLGSK
jgi:tetratricopeptide (TPR) repeat protein